MKSDGVAISHSTECSAHEHKMVYMSKQVNTNVNVSKHMTPRGPAFSEIALFAPLPLMSFEGKILLSFSY